MSKFLLPLAAALVLFGCTPLEVPSPVSSEGDDVVELEDLPAPAGTPVTIQAGFSSDGAATRSRLGKDGDVYSVLWTAGDSFTVLYMANGSYYKGTFTTQDDGVRVASFTSKNTLIGSEYFCFYPDNIKTGTHNGERIYGLNIPAEQTAVAGGIEEGLNRSFAHAYNLDKSLSQPVQFCNVPALLKFSMKGEIVSQIKEITFSGSGTIAGDLVFQYSGSGLEPAGVHFSSDVRSSEVVLKGDFEEGKEYFIEVWPCEMPWFRMDFSDGNGNSVRKQSTKTLNLERSRIKDFGTIDLGDEFVTDEPGPLQTIKYMSATQGTKPATIAVIPEGFTAAEMSTYELLAKSGINALFNTEPYKAYADRFNVYILEVASNESGASITDGSGNVTTAVDSYFGVAWGKTSYSDMDGNRDTIFGFVEENCPDIVDGTHTINEVPVLIIINDARYGGKCHAWSSGKAYCLVPFAYSGGTSAWNYPSIAPSTDDPLPTPVTSDMLADYYHSTTTEEYAEVGRNVGDWRNTLVHEFGGHAFGRLTDEYWSSSTPKYTSSSISSQSWKPPYALNLATNPAAVPWQETMLDNLEVLLSRDENYARIGIWQGGGSYLFGRWRSEKISCMLDNRFYFSAWQRYLIAQRIFTLSGDADLFDFDLWLENDVTLDPVRDIVNGYLAPSAGAPSGEIHVQGPPLPPTLWED